NPIGPGTRLPGVSARADRLRFNRVVAPGTPGTGLRSPASGIGRLDRHGHRLAGRLQPVESEPPPRFRWFLALCRSEPPDLDLPDHVRAARHGHLAVVYRFPARG